MSLEALKDALPEYAKDLKLNLSSLATEASLTEQQRAGTFIACALAAAQRRHHQRRSCASSRPSCRPKR